MPETIIQPRSNIDWGKMGQYVADPIAQSRSLEQQLIPLLFKAKIESLIKRQNIEHAFDVASRSGNGKMGEWNMKITPDGELSYSQKSPAEKQEEIASGRSDKLSNLSAYLTKIIASGKPLVNTVEPGQVYQNGKLLPGETIPRSPVSDVLRMTKPERFNMPSEIKSIRDAMALGSKLKPREKVFRKPTSEEAGLVAAAPVITSSISDIRSVLNNTPDYKWDSGNAFAIGTGKAYLTSDPTTKFIQSRLNNIKLRLSFQEGGKQLTGTEKALIFNQLNPLGKSTDDWLRDLDTAETFLNGKVNVIKASNPYLKNVPSNPKFKTQRRKLKDGTYEYRQVPV